MARRRRKRAVKSMTKGQKAWHYTKIGLGVATVGATIRELYLAFGARREMRRGVFEQALAAAKQRGVKLLVLGNPDGGLMNHMLGRQWQCGSDDTVLCIDPQGCGLCPNQVQGWPEDVLAGLPAHSAVIYDPGALGFANDGAALAAQMARVAIDGEVYVADVEPWSIAAFLEPGRKRRVLQVPQASAQRILEVKPTWFRKEPSTQLRDKQATAMRGLGLAYRGSPYTQPPIFVHNQTLNF